jgi:hypothetical protein
MSSHEWGEFVLEESTVLTYDASIYESRSGTAEGTLSRMVFSDGRSIAVKPLVVVNLEKMDVVGEEEGAIKLMVSASGTFTFHDEHSTLLFDGQWRLDENAAAILVRQHMVAELSARAALSGTGKNAFEGRTIIGELIIRITGQDSSGFGVFKLTGKGTVT